LEEVLKSDRVECIASSDRGVRVMLADGTRLLAQRVVLATNTRIPRIPDWARDLAIQAPPGRSAHTEELDLRGVDLEGEHVLVVGGGLTAGQIALIAVSRGATVTLVCRNRVRRQVFDVQGGWLTPSELRGFYAEPAADRRLDMVREARRSSMTPAVVIALEEASRTGTIHLLEGSEVTSATWNGDYWRVNLGERTEEVHRIWLATGTTARADGEALLAQLIAAKPTAMAGGLPVLDEVCRWPGTEIHLMGALAALQLGPAARNLVGARMATERIARCVAPLERYQYVQPTRPGTPELIRPRQQRQPARP
ncbi:MAG: SidA/IucD/PvdA family monooxygenase, partial [Pseudonocardiaceae bacterium]